MAHVSLESVTKRFPGDVDAVRELDVEVADGELVVLVGPSGCGKTTTLRLVAGLETLTAGTIRIDGQVANRLTPKARDVAMVFQDSALYPHMTVRKNLAWPLELRKTPASEIATRVAEAATLLDIASLLDRRPATLSGGERQRVALGRVIVRRPACALFDEPLSNLDLRLRLALRAEIKRLHRASGTTIIYVTHDQEEAMTLADRLVVMTDGVAQQTGAPLDVYRRPANRFVAGFLGSPPMNFLDGRLAGAHFTDGGEIRTRLPIPTHAARDDTAAVLGVRPHDLHLDPAPDHAIIPARIDVIEPLGDRKDVHAVTGTGARITMRTDIDRSCRVGEAVRLGVAVEKLHVFEMGAFGGALG
ncbi:MAG: ATP-binding cassette domain-containing protein [Phycisphaerae bacterium]|nr:ATP-binding cassette domain-containing protein [Phycisphaerae bacterium]NNF43229.1 ATP-binding cassette domain-containing protein [Phycisphaerales bacterium]